MDLLMAALVQGPTMAQRHSGRKVRKAQEQGLRQVRQGQGMLGVVAVVQEQRALQAWVLLADRNALAHACVAVALAAVAAEQGLGA